MTQAGACPENSDGIRSGGGYRGRLAPSPTGLLHLGHARTFATAWERCRDAQGTLVMRMDDLDGARSRPEFAAAAMEDLRWLGLDWDEGPDVGGPFSPYVQSQRMPRYRAIMADLARRGLAYPCKCSRRDVANALSAPHVGDDEPLYPGTCRPVEALPLSFPQPQRGGVNWRFRVTERMLEFEDQLVGRCTAQAGRDFGDFLLWRKDGLPSYQLACVVDDHDMRITEVVRGRDLIQSTFRQLLLFEALDWLPPAYAHCELVTDASGTRLAKRNAALSLQTLREQGMSPTAIRNGWEEAI